MCIFCERAKQESLDPFYDVGGSGHSSGSAPSKSEKVAAEECPVLRRRRIPCTVVTGFLGAGKTTLVNHILLNKEHGKKLAVIENEYGEVSIDDDLLVSKERASESQQVVLMPNGCMCCRVRGDLIEALKNVVASAKSQEGAAALNGVLLELSGLSELAPVLQTFFADSFVQEHLQLDSVICVCDAPRLHQMLISKQLKPAPGAPAESGTSDGGHSDGADDKETDTAPHAALVTSQLALSDRILLNKMDVMADDAFAELKRLVGAVAPAAAVSGCVRCAVDPSLLLGMASFSLDRTLGVDAGFLEGRSSHHGRRPHAHETLGFSSLSIQEHGQPVDMDAFRRWLTAVLKDYSNDLWRFKGVLWASTAAAGAGRRERVVVQGIMSHMEEEATEWPPAKERRSCMVFIGTISDELRGRLAAGFSLNIATMRRPTVAASAGAPKRNAAAAVPLVAKEQAPVAPTFMQRVSAMKRGGGMDDSMLF